MERIRSWLARAEAKLDEWGYGAWIAAMVLGFILVWPIGLALLFYMIWSGRMGCKGRWMNRRKTHRPSGNSAFDAYREETLKRLDEEQSAFNAFLEKLRRARDQAEFDQFMDEKRRSDTGGPEASPA